MVAIIVKLLRDWLTRLLGQRDHSAQVEAIMVIGRRCAALPERDARSADEILYSDNGLPK